MAGLLNITEAVLLLQEGQIIAYPTEAVYGLGVDACNEAAVIRLCKIKKRPLDKGLIVLVHDMVQIQDWIEPLAQSEHEKLYQLNDGFHFTWLLPATNACPAYLSGQHGSLAVRLTNHPVAASLCRAFNRPLVSTSANVQGASALLKAEAVLETFNGCIAGVLEGAVGGLKEATKIQDIKSGRIYRGT